MIRTEQVCKRYPNGVTALDRVTLCVDPGTIYCLLGPNGAGKSTLLNILLDFIRPTEGRTEINGISVQEQPLAAKRHVVYLPDNVQLFPEMRAIDCLSYFARLAGGVSAREELLLLFDKVRLDRKWECEQVGRFSKGMLQKLGLAAILTRTGNVMILDEPLAGLDPMSSRDFVDTLLDLRSQGTAILMATHDIFRAKQIADRVGILSSGKLVEEISKQALVTIDLESTYLEHFRG